MGAVLGNVMVDANGFTGIETDGPDETLGVGVVAVPVLLEQVMVAKRVELDSVAGAILISNAVRAAVAACLAEAAT